MIRSFVNRPNESRAHSNVQTDRESGAANTTDDYPSDVREFSIVRDDGHVTPSLHLCTCNCPPATLHVHRWSDGVTCLSARAIENSLLSGCHLATRLMKAGRPWITIDGRSTFTDSACHLRTRLMTRNKEKIKLLISSIHKFFLFLSRVFI